MTNVDARGTCSRGHFEGDDEPSRSREEVAEWRERRDPIENYAADVVAAGDLDADRLAAIRDDVESVIDRAVAFARDADEPAAEGAYDDVFVESVPEVERFRRRLAADGDGGGGGVR